MYKLALCLFLAFSQHIISNAQDAEILATDTSQDDPDAVLNDLGKKYGELRALNEILLSDVKKRSVAKDFEGVKAVFERKTNEYETHFKQLMDLAIQVPETELSRDVAILTINTTTNSERDDAIDLLLKFHIRSPRMREIVTGLGYTTACESYCQRILEQNTDPSTLAHVKYQLARSSWRRSDKDRERAREMLWELVKCGHDYPFHIAFGWGPDLPIQSISGAAAELLRKISGNESVKIGEELPDFQSVDLNGKPIALSAYRGKVTLIVFWATWCGPCLKMTELERRLAERYAGLPFEILGICGDDEIDDQVKQVALKHKMIWTSLHDILPNGERLSNRLGAPGWPYCILLDRNGTIKQASFPIGVTNNTDGQEMYFRAEIENLLPEFRDKGK